jgi:hypothetical protein
MEKVIGEALARGSAPEQLWRLLVLEHWLGKASRADRALSYSD